MPRRCADPGPARRSTFQIVVGRPAISNVSTGKFHSTGLGNGSYALSVGSGGIATFVGLTLTMPSGSIDLVVGPLVGRDPQGLVLTESSGTG